MARTSDAGVRKLLGDLAQAERDHEAIAEHLEEQILDRGARKAEEGSGASSSSRSRSPASPG
jgi:rubrerythrin